MIKKHFFPFNNHVKTTESVCVCVCLHVTQWRSLSKCSKRHESKKARKKRDFCQSTHNHTRHGENTHKKKESKFIYLPRGFLAAIDTHTQDDIIDVAQAYHLILVSTRKPGRSLSSVNVLACRKLIHFIKCVKKVVSQKKNKHAKFVPVL